MKSFLIDDVLVCVNSETTEKFKSSWQPLVNYCNSVKDMMLRFEDDEPNQNTHISAGIDSVNVGFVFTKIEQQYDTCRDLVCTLLVSRACRRVLKKEFSGAARTTAT